MYDQEMSLPFNDTSDQQIQGRRIVSIVAVELTILGEFIQDNI